MNIRAATHSRVEVKLGGKCQNNAAALRAFQTTIVSVPGMTVASDGMRAMHAIVTGADGFVGSYIIAALLADGYRVSALIRNNRTSMAPNVDVYRFNLLKPEGVLRPCGRADLFVHAAAQLPCDGIDPALYAAANAVASGSLALQAAMQGIDRMVYISSIGVIGTPQFSPIGVTHPLSPASDYARNKLEGEQRALRRHPSCCALRLTSPYGAQMKPGTVLPTFIARAKAGETLGWYGQGSRRQDFIHARDVAAACLAAARSTHHGPCMLGTGRSVSMKELAIMISRRFNAPEPIQYPLPDPQEGVDWSIDRAETKDLIGFESRIDIGEGIDMTVNGAASQVWRAA